MKIRVPSNVADAFDHFDKIWHTMTQDSINLMLMSFPSVRTEDPNALVLKEYANKYPTRYIRALADGYVRELDLHEEVSKLINEWIDTPYVEDEKKDIKMFAEKITNHIKENL